LNELCGDRVIGCSVYDIGCFEYNARP